MRANGRQKDCAHAENARVGACAQASQPTAIDTACTQAEQPQRAEKPSVKKRALDVLFALVLIAGICLLFYPLVSNAWNEWRANVLIGEYQQLVDETSETDAQTWLASADIYNQTLVGSTIPDAFSTHEESGASGYLAQLAFRADGMMGYINIPRIGQNLPIYHTTSESALSKGVGHLQGSALPVGGENTHCVLSAHRGLPSAALFTDLDQLAVGDRFFIHVLTRDMAYEIDWIQVVEPTQTDSLGIEAGEDLVTLVTCTPYGINSHRLLIRGHRVAYDALDELSEGETSTHSIFTQYWLWILIGLACAAIVVFALWRITRTRKEQVNSRR